MLNNLSVEQLVEQAVAKQINELVHEQEFVARVEQKVIDSLQHRIVAKFANIETVPDLVSTVQRSVSDLFDAGRVPSIDTFVDQSKIEKTIDSAVQDLVLSTIDNLTLDPAWIAKIDQIVNQSMATRLLQRLRDIDLNRLIVEEIDNGIDRWQKKLKDNFETNGIADRADTVQLEVNNNEVAVKNSLTIEQNASIGGSASVAGDLQVGKSLEVHNLILTGSVNVDNRSWGELSESITNSVIKVFDDRWRSSMLDQVLETAKTSGIEFSRVRVNGELLVDGNKLTPTITDTNIETTGTLKNFKTKGPVDLSAVVHIVNGRVGVNTDRPEMALSIWDEDVSVVIGKQAEKHAFMGTSRSQSLSIGTNRNSAIDIDVDGITTVKNLRLGRFQLGYAGSTPGHNGTRGDFLINYDLKPGQPFAWLCLGGVKWQPLYSAK